MRIIEISESKFEKMGELTEKMLKYGGKLMSCISELGDEHGINFREHEDGYQRSMMGNRYHEPYMMNNRYSGGRINYRDQEEWEDDDMEGDMHERRRRNRMGRYY